MAKVTGLDIPQELEQLFLFSTQANFSFGSDIIQKRRSRVAFLKRKGLSLRSPFKFWGSLYRTFTTAEKHVWQTKHTIPGARGFGEYVQNNVNRTKVVMLTTDIPDEIVNPCAYIQKTTDASPGTYLTWERLYNDTVLSKPNSPSRRQYARLLDLRTIKRFSVNIQIRCKYYAPSAFGGANGFYIVLRRHWGLGPGDYDYNLDHVFVDSNGNFDYTYDADWSAQSANTLKVSLTLNPDSLGGSFFTKAFIVSAIDSNGNVTYITNSPDLREAQKPYKGHLIRALTRLEYFNTGNFIPLPVQLYAKL